MSGQRHARCSRLAFEQRYRQSPDPWNFATSAYERDRYDTILAALTRQRYRRAFEPACSVGELTARLAPRCGTLIATDFAAAAVERATQRCRDLPNVDIHHADLTEAPIKGPFDLIVFSEVGYYFEPDQLVAIALALASELDIDGEFVAAHWLGHSADHVLHGDEVHRLLAAHLPLEWIKGDRRPGFRIDSWRRR